jgi:hypothetical protein
MFPRAISGRLKKLAIASALLAFAVASGFAETTVKVPFDFLANGRHCSAGAYTVNLDAQFNMVKLQSADGARTFQWVVLSGAPSPNDTRVILTFDQAESGYALRTIQYHNKITGKLDKNIPEYVPTRAIIGQ